MATYSQIDDNNIVINNAYVADEDCLDENGDVSEEIGRQLLEQLSGHARWVRYGEGIRARIPALEGRFQYHPEHDVFVHTFQEGMVWNEQEQNWQFQTPPELKSPIIELDENGQYVIFDGNESSTSTTVYNNGDLGGNSSATT